ncbi:MAG: putative manganese-dependent inorganic diphosphatase [Syntrophomonadaceae bacterium]
MKPIYVIGHKNPDIDSIAAAISYKIFKQSTDEGLYIAAAAGEVNEETRFVLDHLGFEAPVVLKDVGTTVGDLLDDYDNIYVGTDMSLVELGNLMRKHDLKTVPVLDEKHGFLGLITIGDVAMIYMDALGSGREIEKSPEILRNILDRKVADIMKTRNLVLFDKEETAEEAKKQMLTTRFRNYPVVDDNNRFLGMISRYNLLQMKRKRLILVDHNEKNQAVDNIEDAEILEIVDHHRVGDLQTLSPIFFRNEPVGSTSTLIAGFFLSNDIYINKDLAGLMLAGIMSDTMIFKSPTTTPKDKRVAEELGQISGLDPLKWGKEIFARIDGIEHSTDREIITQDLKEYVSADTIFAVGQVETMNMGQLEKRRTNLVETMREICSQKGYALLCLMVTDILGEGTELFVVGEKSLLAQEAFGSQLTNDSIFLKGVMSRKKQVVPVIYEVLRKDNVM